MKILISGIALLIMIVGGGIAAMKALELGPFAPTPVEGASKMAEKPAADPLEPPRFVDIDPLVIPVFQDSGVAATIQINIKLETVGAKNEQRVTRLVPKLYDAFFKDLLAFMPRLLREQDRANVYILKRRMQMVGDRIAGKGVIDSVLVQAISRIDTQNRP